MKQSSDNGGGRLETSSSRRLRRLAMPRSGSGGLVRAVVALGMITAYSFCKGAGSDPLTLLKGVESIRLETPPSRLRMRLVYRNRLGTTDREVVGEFDGSRRRFRDANGGSSVRCAFDGEKVIHYDGSGSVTIRDTSTATSDYLFDPRLLGITTTYSWMETLSSALPYADASDLVTVGQDRVRDHLVWHVRLRDTHDQWREVWVDADGGFRVYRYSLGIEGVKTNVSESFYEDNAYPWLPTRVETRSYDASGNVIEERETLLKSAEKYVPLPQSLWTIVGLEPRIGATVTDLRVRRRLGYWDGAGISKWPPEPHRVHRIGLWRFAAVVCVLGLPLAYLLVAKRLSRRS